MTPDAVMRGRLEVVIQTEKIMLIKKFTTLLILIMFAGYSQSYSQGNYKAVRDSLEVNFNGDAQVSVGSHYVGVEMHHSSIMPERISFYYPVANSIDLSTDYYKRDTSFIMAAGLKIGNGQKKWIGLKPYPYTLTPYAVSFHKEDAQKGIKVTYDFCKDYPAMIVTFEITNKSKKSQSFEFYTHLETSLRTSHTFALMDKASTSFNKKGSCIYADFNNIGTQFAQVFVANAGLQPVSYNTIGDLKNSRTPNNDYWFNNDGNLPEKIHNKKTPGIPAAKFLYKKKLAPNQTMKIVQIIGSCKLKEGRELVLKILKDFKKCKINYEKYVLNYVKDGNFKTGNHSIDKSYLWAKAMLAVDQHYIDGKIRPMPCPAEYNFYFTHDVMLTDLAAINFDLKRVKRDLEYTIAHATKDKIIPHAYYWKDSVYTTEYAGPDNWNNFWFIIVSANYLKYSGDKTLLKKLYPYLTVCLQQTLKNKRRDIIWAYRPDWWDIGRNFGPRAYMTILEIKALREYVYISTVLGKNQNKIDDYEVISNNMREQMINQLWSNKYKYLMSYTSDGVIDPHYYMGSLLAADYHLLDSARTNELVNTASDKLLDPKLGIYDVYPMDFSNLIKKWKFVGNEAGPKFLYLNGGIWPHANCWYSLALMADGKKNEAYKFIQNTMTLEGIMNGPNGHPAMYEVRDGNFNNPKVYGRIDKPEFMWAAGWYIYSIYHLYGIRENTWNIELDPYLPKGEKSCTFTLNAHGKKYSVNIKGEGNYIKEIKYSGKEYPSAVIPYNSLKGKNIDITLGTPDIPYVQKTNSILLESNFNKNSRELSIKLKAFKKHRNQTYIISPFRPKNISIDGKSLKDMYTVKKVDNIFWIMIENYNVKDVENLVINF